MVRGIPLPCRNATAAGRLARRADAWLQHCQTAMKQQRRWRAGQRRSTYPYQPERPRWQQAALSRSVAAEVAMLVAPRWRAATCKYPRHAELRLTPLGALPSASHLWLSTIISRTPICLRLHPKSLA
jgi:hypothetical protein